MKVQLVNIVSCSIPCWSASVKGFQYTFMFVFMRELHVPDADVIIRI